MSDDDRDYTDRFNTQLSPKQEMEFQKLQNKGDLYDYDLRGAFKANGFKPFAAGHLTDKFKKPNHPTFSTESQYSGVDGAKGGTWTKRPDGSYSFKPGQGNVYTAQELRDYFAKQEKGNEVVLPPDVKGIDTSKFRRSGNVEDRRGDPRVDPGLPNTGDFPAEPWQSERIAKTQGRNRLADALGRQDLPEAGRRVAQEVADRPASFDERFDGTGSVNGSTTASAAPLMSMPAGDRQQAIIRAAREQGIDPSAALAIAERESNFDPSARSSKTIRGMFQMRGDLRHQYGVGDSDDPYAQASGWGKFFKDNKAEMSRVLGRDATDAEGYLGHHFGSTRAARMLKMDPATPVDQVFTENEMSLNPHFGKAGTVGALNSSITADIGKRQAKFGGAGAELPDLAEFGTPVEGGGPLSAGQSDQRVTSQLPDLSSFGTIASQGPDLPQPSAAAASSAPDLSSFGTPV